MQRKPFRFKKIMMISSGFKALFLYKRARECEGYERWDEAFYIEFFILIILKRFPKSLNRSIVLFHKNLFTFGKILHATK